VDLRKALLRIADEPANPALFAIYHDAAVAAAIDDFSSVRKLLQLFAEVALAAEPVPLLVSLDDRDLAGQADRYRRMIDDDEGYRIALGPVNAATREAARLRIAEAMALIRQSRPDMAEEIAVAARQIVLADGSAGEQSFSGASSFFLWGALVINPAANADRLTLAETLVHESGHALLFGLAEAEPLVANRPDERYRSPLRDDPRPMEGIVHATYVLSRMAKLMEAIAARCALSDPERAQAAAMAQSSRGLFLDGLAVVREHARFTERGRAVLGDWLATSPIPTT